MISPPLLMKPPSRHHLPTSLQLLLRPNDGLNHVLIVAVPYLKSFILFARFSYYFQTFYGTISVAQGILKKEQPSASIPVSETGSLELNDPGGGERQQLPVSISGIIEVKKTFLSFLVASFLPPPPPPPFELSVLFPFKCLRSLIISTISARDCRFFSGEFSNVTVSRAKPIRPGTSRNFFRYLLPPAWAKSLQQDVNTRTRIIMRTVYTHISYMNLKGRRRRILRSRFFLIPTCVPLFNNLNHITIKNTHVRITIGSIPFGTTTTQNISGLILYQHIRPPSARTTFFVCNKFSSANLF